MCPNYFLNERKGGGCCCLKQRKDWFKKDGIVVLEGWLIMLTEQSVRAEDLSSVPSLWRGGLQPPVTRAPRESYASALFKHMHLCVYNHTYRHTIESKVKEKKGGKGDREDKSLWERDWAYWRRACSKHSSGHHSRLKPDAWQSWHQLRVGLGCAKFTRVTNNQSEVRELPVIFKLSC